jgi:TatD DNase family protein
MKIFDSHCHLHDDRFDPDRDRVIDSALGAGVRGFFNCGATPEGWGSVLSLSLKYVQVIPAFGLHPWYIHAARPDWYSKLCDIVQTTACAIGEIGLDLAVDETPIQVQEEVFRQQLSLALSIGVPVNIHCRKAWEPLLRNLKRYWDKGRPFVIHSFSGTTDTIEPLAGLGAYFSFGGSLTRSHNTRAHKSIVNVPRERLLVETDAPDIPPEISHSIDNDKPNLPANILYVIDKAAELLGMSVDDVARITWDNACTMLRPVLGKRGFDISYDA